MRACVVGAGPGGIVTAKVLLENGFDVTVFDKYRQVGGVWSSGGCYDGLANQSALRIFEFADLPNRLHFAGAARTPTAPVCWNCSRSPHWPPSSPASQQPLRRAGVAAADRHVGARGRARRAARGEHRHCGSR
ncbi:NAD(P)-binding protein [Streptomyces sp. MNU76]|uniref:NAD(P)-binding protein n=1 Tax=Streptomyces sp. MNU76 TaxID=2560026 RepID=UPI0035A97768